MNRQLIFGYILLDKLKDISLEDTPKDVNIHDENISKSPEAFLGEGDILNDVYKTEKINDISLEEVKHIKISRKKGKNFDALEKKGFISRIHQSKIIRLKQKKKDNKVFHIYIKSVRKIKTFGYIGKFLLIGVFFCMIIVVGYFDKIVVENRVNAGYEKLLYIKEGHISFQEIQKNVNDARFDLLLSDMLFFPFSLFSGDKIDSVESVISGGRNLSHALDKLLELYSKTQKFIDQKSLSNIYFTQLFLNISGELQDIESALESTLTDYKSIVWLPSQSLEEKKNEAIRNIEYIQEYLAQVNENFPVFLDILGHSGKKRYLIVFQNADEIRPTGGFMGSMGLLEVFKGKVDLFQKKDVYAIEWDLKKSNYERQKAPKGINELTENFGLRDANYFVNIKDSSSAINFFMKEADIKIDGIIYINQNILLHLLEITGPVYFEPLDTEVTSENFSELMSLVVEAKTFKQGTLGTPKQVLFDFMEVFAQKLMSDAAYFSYLQSLVHDVKSRDVTMWSFNDTENTFLQDLGLGGIIDYDRSLDFIYPVYTSLSGNKSDRYIERSYSQNVEKLTETCDFLIKTEIKTSHNMTRFERERVEKYISEYDLTTPNLLKIQGLDRNRQFVRIILPKNSEIAPQNDMDIFDYGTRKGIEFFLETNPQESSFYTFSYILKNPECKNYDFMLYKQPGIPSYNININTFGEKFEYFERKEDFYFEVRK